MKREERISGLERIRVNTTSYKKGTFSDFYSYNNQAQKEESEDTKIRRSIHNIIDNMAKEGKISIEIKIVLTEKYPTYEEYITKMINQYFGKLNSNNTRKSSNTCRGDER